MCRRPPNRCGPVPWPPRVPHCSCAPSPIERGRRLAVDSPAPPWPPWGRAPSQAAMPTSRHRQPAPRHRHPLPPWVAFTPCDADTCNGEIEGAKYRDPDAPRRGTAPCCSTRTATSRLSPSRRTLPHPSLKAGVGTEATRSPTSCWHRDTPWRAPPTPVWASPCPRGWRPAKHCLVDERPVVQNPGECSLFTALLAP